MTEPADPPTDDLDQQVVDIRRQAQAAQAELARITAKAHGANGVLSVTVDARGRPQQLRLTAQAMRMGPDALAAAILDCVQQATIQADVAVQAVTDGFARLPQIRDAIQAVHEYAPARDEAPRPAQEPLDDDAYFERMRQDPLGRRS